MAGMKGGEKFSAALQKMAGALSTGNAVRIGFLAGSTYPDGMPVAMIAVFNEFGTGTAPPRPFFRTMIAAKKGEWPKAIADTLKANDLDAKKTLELVGQAVAGQLRQSIVDLVSPPLADSTIIKKGGHAGMIYNPKDPSTFPAKPLIETGHLLNSVDYIVVGP